MPKRRAFVFLVLPRVTLFAQFDTEGFDLSVQVGSLYFNGLSGFGDIPVVFFQLLDDKIPFKLLFSLFVGCMFRG